MHDEAGKLGAERRRRRRQDVQKARLGRTIERAIALDLVPGHDHPEQRCRYATLPGIGTHALTPLDRNPGHPDSLNGGRCVPEPWSDPRRCRRCWYEKMPAAIQACRHARAYREKNCGNVLLRPVECDIRLCPTGEARRSARLVDAFMPAVEMTPEARARFMVWTDLDAADGDLAAALTRIQRAQERMRRSALIKGGRCRERRPGGAPFHACPPAHEPMCTALVCAEACGRRRCYHRVVEGCGRDGCHHRKRCASCLDPKRCPHRTHRRERNCPRFRHHELEAPVRGWLRSTEVTRTEHETWHPHMNVIADAPYLDHRELREAWRRASRGAFIVWIRPLRKRRGQSLRDATREQLKYVAKIPSVVDPANPGPAIEFLEATRGRRLVAGWGRFFNVRPAERERPAGEIEVTDPTNPHLRVMLPERCPFGDHFASWQPYGTVPRHEGVFDEGARQLRWEPPRVDSS